MNISQLIEALKDPSIVLSFSDKLLVGVSVALLAMVIVFIILLTIAGIITLLQRDGSNKKQITPKVVESMEVNKVEEENNEDIGELVSVITAAIASATGNSTNNIVVRKIQRTNNNRTSWERMAKNTTK